jgi:hypothetical protein
MRKLRRSRRYAQIYNVVGLILNLVFFWVFATRWQEAVPNSQDRYIWGVLAVFELVCFLVFGNMTIAHWNDRKDEKK